VHQLFFQTHNLHNLEQNLEHFCCKDIKKEKVEKIFLVNLFPIQWNQSYWIIFIERSNLFLWEEPSWVCGSLWEGPSWACGSLWEGSSWACASWFYNYLWVPITTKVVSLNPSHGEVYLIQHYVIKFVS